MTDTQSIDTPRRRLSPTLIAALFFVLFDAFVLYATYLHRKSELQPMNYHRPVPVFEWKGFDGKVHNIKELKGHVVVLHFWASWCPPCREEFPKLLKTAAENKDIIFLTISSDEDTEKPRHFLNVMPNVANVDTPPNVLYAWDPARLITYDEFGTARYPESIIVDRDQFMRRKYPLPVDWDSPEVRNYLNELKAEK